MFPSPPQLRDERSSALSRYIPDNTGTRDPLLTLLVGPFPLLQDVERGNRNKSKILIRNNQMQTPTGLYQITNGLFIRRHDPRLPSFLLLGASLAAPDFAALNRHPYIKHDTNRKRRDLFQGDARWAFGDSECALERVWWGVGDTEEAKHSSGGVKALDVEPADKMGNIEPNMSGEAEARHGDIATRFYLSPTQETKLQRIIDIHLRLKF
ncbi:hypothetical protein BJ138DRAFT_1197676 [Hygrophoropsis aurantiaca]|uniref:Uncharacterized protein n=1 Tax=Hygrophoropsis aurantiaca TaxID=72124 RepID=A0ACB7ZQJ6_9AGAM|nr:hypothetical protein BJ138DRAFT_1197676 [Hygrophoropsis aurantiaca]